tara:strand:- start:41351 stop:41911 length:561 start_codon:yes stop_codon:yes gene_type:complete
MPVVVTGMNTQKPRAVASLGDEPKSILLDTLYDDYSSYVAAIGLRLLGRDSEIDDLVQDVFLDAVRGLGQLRDPEATRGWLATLTVRTARRRLRRNRLRRFVVGGDEYDYSNLVDSSASPEERLLLTRCYEVLETLPANQRLAWTLRHVEGESLTSVATRCECSLASAKRYVQRAQERLQEVLGND